MAPYYLKASGGTWNNIPDMNTAMEGWLSGAGLSEHKEIRVGNGESFSGMIQIAPTSGSPKFNGYTITIKSDLVTPTSPGIINCTDKPWPIRGDDYNSNSDAGGVIIDSLILKAQASSGSAGSTAVFFNEGLLQNANRFLTIQNCLIYICDTDSENSLNFNCYFDDMGSSPGKFRFINNSVYISDTQFPTGSINMNCSATAHAQSLFANNFFGSYKISSLTVTTGKNKNNTVHSYNGVNTWSVSGTPVNLNKGNPNTVAAVIQSSTDTVATMAGRNAHPTASSALLIAQADVSSQTTLDIEGYTRG